LARFIVLAAVRRRSDLEERHPHAEAPVHLREFETPDEPAADQMLEAVKASMPIGDAYQPVETT
jgi:hypothetical protein